LTKPPQSTGEPLLRVRNLSVSFRVGERYLKAVNDISFDLRRGETLAVVGESGSGKSTLARTLLRLYEPDDGSIEFDGTDIAHFDEAALRRWRPRMQMVFQDPFSSLDPRWTVGRIVGEPLVAQRITSGAALETRVAQLLESVGLDPDSARRRPSQLSGGQRQRVAIARAMALEPELLVADEPVSALDVSVQAQIMALLRDTQRHLGSAMVLISHDLGVVYRISDRTAVMYLGAIVEITPTEELIPNPAHPYTAALIASAPSLHVDDGSADMDLKGEPGSPLELPTGCRFHPRCPVAKARCEADVPPMRSFGRGLVACHYPGTLRVQNTVVAFPR
jgi:oligopeptide/dipeptide ABC transporter ATP-binding protein